MSINQLIAARFRIADPDRDLLGRGGMGEVYRASDTQTGETVAVKLLNPEMVDPELLDRFRREGEALRQLNHPNIVRFVAAVEEDGQHYLVMEYVTGGSLEDLLAKQGRLPFAQAVEIALDLADALTRAHRLGILHRDLKPANVLLDAVGAPKLADFGIAYRQNSPHLTQTGVLVGTVDYLSPEACQGEAPDEKSDIWSFGVLLFQMLSGRLPFEGPNLTARLTAILTQPVPDLAQLAPDAPAGLVDLVMRMLVKDPLQRVPSVRQVGMELEAIQKGRQPLNPLPAMPVTSATAPRHNLPAQLSRFIGREKDIAQVRQRLGDYRLVTLTGSGGVGKTRLAIQVGRDLLPLYPQGVWLVELAPLADPAMVPLAVMKVFELPDDARRSPLQILTDYLHEKTVLIVLDNCEHVIDACAELAGDLLSRCPDLRMLASSREALGVEGEAALRVRSLSLPPKDEQSLEALAQAEAVQLFLDRAATALPGFALTQANMGAIVQVCRRLDGIPLAIELAASRVRLLKVEQVAARLDDAFRLLTGGSRTALPRQQTLRATIDWSYNLLSEAEQILLRRLAVFASGSTLEAAEAICSDSTLKSGDVLDLLAQLVNKSLVTAEREQGDETRYFLLETIRQYAREKLNESGEGEAVRQRHARWFLELAERAEPKLHGHGQLEWLDRIEQEHENFRVALEWSLANDIETGIRVSNALTWFWTLRGHGVEGYQQIEKFLAVGPLGPSVVHARALAWASWLAVFTNHIEQSADLAETGAAMARLVGDTQALGWSLLHSAMALYLQGEHARALPLAEQSLELFRNSGIRWGERNALGPIGYISQALGNYVRARAIFQESLDLSRELGDIDGISWSFFCLADLALEQDQLEQALIYGRECLIYSQQVKEKYISDWATRLLGEAFLELGDYPQAKALFEKSAAMEREMGDFRLAGTCARLGRISRLQGDYHQAAKHYTEGLRLAQENGLRQRIGWCLDGLAELAALGDQPHKAARLYGAAEAIPEFRLDIYPHERRILERSLNTIRSRVEETIFEVEYEAGRKMGLDDAIAYALEMSE